jgi:hypothetical protein
MINARMRDGGSWSDLCILNMSSRGLMGRSAVPPRPGSFVEVRRGPYVIVARVVWTKEQMFGVSTQDVVPIDDIVANKAIPMAPPGGLPPPERRRHRRRPALSLEERSGQCARILQFSFITALGCSVAVAGAATLHDALAKPMATIAATLDRSASEPATQSAIRQNP